MIPRRLQPDAVLGDVVRARLEALVAEIAPRRAVPRPPGLIGEAADDLPDSADALPDPPPAAADPPARATAATGSAASAASTLVGFGRRHAAVLAVGGLIAVLWAAWAVFHARTVPIAEAAPTPQVTPAAATSRAADPTPVRVHVIGAVASPGVVALPVGARVEDAVEAAGGLTPTARPGDLNLAAVVADGAQIVVGDERAPGGEVRGVGAAASGEGASAPLDLNAASVDQLDTLPGVGPVTARAIVAWRTEHGRFTRVEELQEVDGIGPKSLAQIAPHVRVG